MSNVLATLIAVLGWGLWAFFQKLAVKNMSPLLMQLCNAYVYSAFAPLMYLAMKAHNASFAWSSRGIMWTALATMCGCAAGYAFLFAIQNRPVNQVLPWVQTYPILSFVLCWVFIGETLTTTKAVGMCFLLTGALLMNR